jgi:hypothetical protein
MRVGIFSHFRNDAEAGEQSHEADYDAAQMVLRTAIDCYSAYSLITDSSFPTIAASSVAVMLPCTGSFSKTFICAIAFIATDTLI